MRLLSIQQLFNEEIVQALCLTLVHSLWQGLLLAILAAIVILLTRKSGAALRYNLLSSLFVLFFACSCMTFALELHTGQARVVVTDLAALEIVSAGHADPAGSPLSETGARSGVGVLQQYMEGFLGYCNVHAYLLVTFWMVVLSARFINLLAGLGKVQRLRYYKVTTPSAYWRSRVQELAVQLRISTGIGLLESELVKAPIVIGWLKPVILIPLGLLSRIPPEQVEAVLLHELAHVRRKDYFVNLLQSLGEMIYFFNPGVRWVSSLIRDEREHCCDDIAIVQTQNKQQFVEALVAFQEHANTSVRHAMGFPGKGGSLLDRARRIIYNNNKTLNNMEKLFVAGSLVITSFLTLTVFAQKAPQTGPVKKNSLVTSQAAPSIGSPAISSPEISAPPVQAIEAPVPSASQNTTLAAPVIEKDTSILLLNGIYDINADGIQYRLHMDEDSLLLLFVNGKRIPEDKLDEYRPRMEVLWKRMKEKLIELQRQAEVIRVSEEVKLERAEVDRGRAEEIKIKAESMELMAEKYRAEAMMQKLSAEDGRKQAELAKMHVEALMEKKGVLKKEAELMRLQSEDSRKAAAELNEKANEMKAGNGAFAKQAEDMKHHAGELRTQAALLKLKAEVIEREAEVAKVRAEESKSESNRLIENMTEDLIREHVIKNKKELKLLTLTEEGLEVNEVRQPQAIYHKFREKYLKDEKTRIRMDFRDHSRQLNVSHVR